MVHLWVGEAGPRRDGNSATVGYSREQAPYSQYNSYSLRRDHCSFDSTLQERNRMTICSWKTQSPKCPWISSAHILSYETAKQDVRPRVCFGSAFGAFAGSEIERVDTLR